MRSKLTRRELLLLSPKTIRVTSMVASESTVTFHYISARYEGVSGTFIINKGTDPRTKQLIDTLDDNLFTSNHYKNERRE